MKARVAAVVTILLLVATPAFAHRLDEYLQATLISVERDRVHAQIRLAPGVNVFPFVFSGIDTNADSVLSADEQRRYAERVLGDLSLAIDGAPLPLTLAAWRYASLQDLQEGLGEIRIDFEAVVPSGSSNRRLTFENRHQRRISVYLVNSLVPSDPAVRIAGQSRNDDQSLYRLDFIADNRRGTSASTDAVAHSGGNGFTSLLIPGLLLIAIALLARRLNVNHIHIRGEPAKRPEMAHRAEASAE